MYTAHNSARQAAAKIHTMQSFNGLILYLMLEEIQEVKCSLFGSSNPFAGKMGGILKPFRCSPPKIRNFEQG